MLLVELIARAIRVAVAACVIGGLVVVRMRAIMLYRLVYYYYN